MAHEKNIVDDEYNSFISQIDYNKISTLEKITSSISTIYSIESVKKINRFLDQWLPDIVHIHNYNFQITPSILKVFKSRNIKVVQTIHDSQMVCPYHRLYNFQRETTCTKCVTGSFSNCIKDRCFDNSVFKSVIGAAESYLYHGLDYYNKYIDHYISPSLFLKELVQKRVNKPIVVIPNFVDELLPDNELLSNKDSYYLYYGRVSKEKGIADIVTIFESLNLPLYIVGNGDAVADIKESKYITYLGPKYGEELFSLIAKAKYVIQPSKWFENCPMTIIESFSLGIPVIGADHSGFLELISNDITGYRVDFTNKNKLQAELKKIDTNYNVKLRHQSKEFFDNNLSKNHHLKQLLSVYETVL